MLACSEDADHAVERELDRVVPRRNDQHHTLWLVPDVTRTKKRVVSNLRVTRRRRGCGMVQCRCSFVFRNSEKYYNEKNTTTQRNARPVQHGHRETRSVGHTRALISLHGA